MPNFFVDVRQDLGYASFWPSWSILPIFKVKQAPKRAYPPFRWFSCAFWVIRIPTWKIPKVLVDVHQDLVYASGWPSRPVRPIFKVKQAPKRIYPSFRRFSCAIANQFLGDPDSNVKNAKFFCGRASRPYLSIRLALAASPTHFEDQTSSEASIPLILMIFLCYI